MGIWEGCGRRHPNPLAALIDLCGADFWLHQASYWIPLGSEHSKEVRVLRWRLECLLSELEQEIKQSSTHLFEELL